MTSKDLHYQAFNFLRLSKQNTGGGMTKSTEIFSTVLKAGSPRQQYQLLVLLLLPSLRMQNKEEVEEEVF